MAETLTLAPSLVRGMTTNEASDTYDQETESWPLNKHGLPIRKGRRSDR